jgi:excisionase family DNA binding protein
MAVSPWLTRQGVADYLDIDIQTVDNWSAAGRLTKHAIGRVVRFHRDEVDAAMRGELV